MTRSPDPTRDLALIALNGAPGQHVTTLKQVIDYAFDQLCWRMTPDELEAVIDGLKAKLVEDA